jgi:hypothetical protein
MYTMESKDDFVFIEIFFHPILLLMRLMSHVTCPRQLRDINHKCHLQLKCNKFNNEKICGFFWVVKFHCLALIV